MRLKVLFILCSIIALAAFSTGCQNNGSLLPYPDDDEPTADCATAYLNGEAYFTDQDTLTFGLSVVYFTNTQDSAITMSYTLVQERVHTVNARYAPARIKFVLTNVRNIYGFLGDNTDLQSKSIGDHKIFKMSDHHLHNLLFGDEHSITAFVYASSGCDIDASGMAGGIGSSFFAIRYSYFASDQRTTEHELGHCLALFHTHQDDKTAGYTVTLGDHVCDTPVDRGIKDYVDQDCSVDASVPVDEGSAELLVKNLMGYHRRCREEFTPGQIARMRWAISQSPDLRSRLLNRADRIEQMIDNLN